MFSYSVCVVIFVVSFLYILYFPFFRYYLFVKEYRSRSVVVLTPTTLSVHSADFTRLSVRLCFCQLFGE